MTIQVIPTLWNGVLTKASEVAEARSPLTVRDVLEVVSIVCTVPMRDLCGPWRSRDLARARQLAMLLARDFTKRSYPEIGRSIGHRDHTTIIHGERVMRALVVSDIGWRWSAAMARSCLIARAMGVANE